ncbi:MAG: alpha-1,2-fucosyltransferase [bacterium]|nr:alpha-1,2-fucosyltransferase [bacterium]
MIIVKLMGGLGNQMFQYAAARRLAHFNNTSLKMDLNWFDNNHEVYTSREYVLDKFEIQADLAADEDIKALKVGKHERRRSFFGKKEMTVATSYVVEKYFHFDPEILNLTDNIYLEGYWQSEKYFIDIKDIIYKEFEVKVRPEEETLEMADWIESSESVSLHIRRGDYVSNPATRKIHGVCDLDYYSRCVKQITETVKDPHFFIFSDDCEWAKKNLKLSYPMTIISNNGAGRECEDLRLMSKCKHQIIANSSFSWWGGWLNHNPDKIVIAPKKWFNKSNANTNDIIPGGWIKL